MAIQIPIITEFQDQGLKSAKGAFDNFKLQVSGAEGAMGKFKAGSTAAMDAVKANAGAFAIAGGAAFATFALEGVNAFKDLALEAGKFSAATGTSIEDASRWKEVSGDLGINIDAVEGAIGRMNKTIGSDPKILRNLGDDVVYTDGGLLNVNETFLNVIQRLKDIKDPAERAREGAKLLGKKWTEVAPLIEMGAGQVRTALEGVADAKLINQEEFDKARRFRDAMDGLKDSVENVSLAIGEALIPLLSDVAEFSTVLGQINIGDKSLLGILSSKIGPGFFLDQAKEGFQNLKGAIDPASSAFERTSGFIDIVADGLTLGLAPSIGDSIAGWIGLTDETKKHREEMEKAAPKIWDWVRNMGEAKQTSYDVGAALEDVKLKFQELTNEIKGDMEMRNLERQMDKVKEAGIKAFGGTHEDLLAYQDEVDRTRLDLLAVADQMDLITQKRVAILVERGDLEAAWTLVQNINRGIGATAPGVPSGMFLGIGGGIQPRAEGGPVTGGRPYIVGENGPELFVPGMSGGIIPNSGVTGGGANITINVQGADPNAVVRALQQYVRLSGPVPVNTRAM